MHHDAQTIEPGWTVYASDDEKIGDVSDVGQREFLVTKGLIFTKDLYIPFSAIDAVDAAAGRIRLTATSSEIEDMAWDRPGSSDRGAYDRDLDDETTAAVDTDVVTDRTDRASTMDTDADTLRVPVREEELTTRTTARQAGEVRVDKDVVEEQRELDVPVSRDTVEVRRVAADRPATGDEKAFIDEDTIRVPVTAEEVEVRKEPRVVEEIEITKRRESGTKRVSDTVRREHVDVEEEGDVGLVGAGSASAMTGSDLDDSRSSGLGGQRLEDEDDTRRDPNAW